MARLSEKAGSYKVRESARPIGKHVGDSQGSFPQQFENDTKIFNSHLCAHQSISHFYTHDHLTPCFGFILQSFSSEPVSWLQLLSPWPGIGCFSV